MTLRLTPALEQRLEQVAPQTHSSPDELAQEGMDLFLAQEEQILAIIERGRADVAAGRLLGPEKVLACIEGMFASQ
jgi:predicted transcriptional regulator